MRNSQLLAALAALLLSVATVVAQTTPAPASPAGSSARPGYGPGGPGYGPGGPGMGGGPGMWRGPGAGPGTGPDYTPGWGMMTPQERDDHHKRMWGSKNAQECRQAMDDHVKLMNERARQRGVGPMPGPRHDACAGFQG